MREKSLSNSPSAAALVRVLFEFTDAAASTVSVAGTFNDWKPALGSMLAWGEGRWLVEISLPTDTYEYCLVVDGEWIPDPRAEKNVRNPFGGENSVLDLRN